MPRKASSKLPKRGSTRRTRRESFPRTGDGSSVSNPEPITGLQEAQDPKINTYPKVSHRESSTSTSKPNIRATPQMDPLLTKEIRRIGVFGISILCMLIGISILLN